MRHLVGLMDCNNFFVSCERLFRPDLRKKPVAVLSSNDGCIVARSQEVKDLGIPMGIPYFKVQDICKKERITLFSSNFTLYRDLSARVMEALRDEVGTCEVYSIDEAFFKVSGKIPEADIYSMRERIMQKTGIPVSFGIGATKTIAKAANVYAKKQRGVCTFDAEAWTVYRKDVSCGSVWGIGRQTTEKLRKFDIHSVEDFLQRGITFHRANFGVVGERMYFELSGNPAATTISHPSDTQKSMASTRSFHAEVRELHVLESAIAYHVTHIGEKLRKSGLSASNIRILAAPSRFGDFTLRKSYTGAPFLLPTADTRILLKEALRLLHELYDPEIPYKKAGVIVGGLIENEYNPGSLFEKETIETNPLLTITDALNERYGQGTVRPAITLGSHKWKERAALRSKEYTTSWTDIASIKAS